MNVIYVPYEIFNKDKDNEKNLCKVFSIAVDKDTVGILESKVNDLVSSSEETKDVEK